MTFSQRSGVISDTDFFGFFLALLVVGKQHLLMVELMIQFIMDSSADYFLNYFIHLFCPTNSKNINVSAQPVSNVFICD